MCEIQVSNQSSTTAMAWQNSYLTGQALIPRRAMALLHIQSSIQASIMRHGDLHADPRDARRAQDGVVRASNQNVIQVGQHHQQVFPSGGHAIRTLPVLLHRVTHPVSHFTSLIITCPRSRILKQKVCLTSWKIN